ncbi:MAG: hypothetical protein ACTSVA_02990 [Candidatus Njordarchaeales archaeon]
MFNKIKEFFLRKPVGKAVVSDTVGSLWKKSEEPLIDRKNYMKLYVENPLARQAIDMTVSDVVGGGFFTDADDEEARRIVDKFCEEVGLDDILFLVVRDMLVTGDGLVEKIYDREVVAKRKVKYKDSVYEDEVIAPAKDAKLVNLKRLPPWTLQVKVTPLGEICWWKQKLSYSSSIKFHPDKILDFRWNPTGLDSYGTSELKSVYSELKDLDEIRSDFIAITKRYAKPPIIWVAKGLSKEQILQHKKNIESKKADEDVFLNSDLITPTVLEIDPRGRFENYYLQVMNAVIIGLQTPTLTSISQSNRAGAQEIVKFYQRKIKRIQRVVKRTVEHELFEPLIIQSGRKEVPRLRWKAHVESKEILELFDRGIYSPYQTRQVLKKMGFDFPKEEIKNEGEQV